jgi:hypothetical protein
MFSRPAALAIVILLGLALPAAAQERENPSRSVLQQQYMPTPPPTAAQLAVVEQAENPAITAVAHSVYAQVAGGKIDRSRLTSELAQAWSPSIEQTASQQLGAFGNPAWSYVENTFTQAGWTSVYRLAYEKTTVYMSIGVADNGTVYALRLASAPPPRASF